MEKRPPRPRRLPLAAALAAAAVFGAALCLNPSLPHAAVPRATVAELAARADLAVHGRVKEVESRWNQDRTAIYTKVTLDVLNLVGSRTTAASNPNVRGAAPSAGAGGEVVLHVPGGVVGGTGMGVSGASRPEPGGEAIVLLAAKGPDVALDADAQTLTVVGGARGWLEVEAGTVDVGRGRTAPVGEVLSTIAASLKK